MPHHTELITTIVGGLVLAFLFGLLAQRLRLSPLVGYLLAGVVAGPFTPGFVADLSLAPQLAEIGVILLMFGVGLHFSLKDLMAVKSIAIPGAIVQIAIATLLGMGLSVFLGWTPLAGFVFGLSLSTASTVVLLRALQDRHLLETRQGHIAIGWLIVEDLACVLLLVMLPALANILGTTTGGSGVSLSDPAGIQAILMGLGLTIAKVATFVAFMLIVGRRAIPWLLHRVALTGSRELFRLAVFAIALGVAFASAELFGVSFALGAFFAGMILGESELSHQAGEEILPLRDAFAVLFFVSVGMMLNPTILLRDFWPLMATVAIIMIGKSLAAMLIVRAFGHKLSTALTISASLAQIGEFAFIIATLGVSLKLMPEAARDLVLAGAIFSILLNPLAFAILDKLRPWLEAREGTKAGLDAAPDTDAPKGLKKSTLRDHVIVIGYGRVGSLLGEALREEEVPFLVIEENPEIAERLRAAGVEVILGPDSPAAMIEAANVEAASRMFVAIPNCIEAGRYIEQTVRRNPELKIVARAHEDREVAYLQSMGTDTIIMGEREIARAMMLYLPTGVSTPAPLDPGESGLTSLKPLAES
jgi:CPA2 family monovalent cation:H+ antiporter-2